MTPCITAITGGIGAGKSVVSRILIAMGYPVYDSDFQAKRLMDTDCEIHRRLVSEIHPLAVVNGTISRRTIAAIVFSDPQALVKLNAIVHPRLVAHFRHWCAEHAAPRVFIETAILHQCPALHPHIDIIWNVTAPIAERVHRVMARSALTAEQVEARIAAQQKTDCALPAVEIHTINNAPDRPILPQIHNLL